MIDDEVNGRGPPEGNGMEGEEIFGLGTEGRGIKEEEIFGLGTDGSGILP